MEGVDYSDARPNLDALWNAGIRFVCRYLAYTPNPKVLLKPELEDIHAHGFGVILNWEQASGDMLRGYDVGHAHAMEALRQANTLGAPNNVPIIFSCDVDVTTQMAYVEDYLNAAKAILGYNRVGVYGEKDVIDACVPDVCAWGWQTYAWSGGAVSDKAHFIQYQNNVTIAGQSGMDRDRSLKDNFGAWFGGQMEQVDKVVGNLARDNTIGNLFADEGNFRDWWYGVPGVFDGKNPPPAGSRADLVVKAAQFLADGGNLAGLSDTDRAAIKALTDAVTALNSRLSTP